MPSNISRRSVLQGLTGALISGAGRVFAAESLKLNESPFALGVASGYPTTSGVVLWTRLVNPTLSDMAVPVKWEIASDERMRRIVRRGEEWATPEWAHSLHIEVAGLQPGRDYWYRFTAGGEMSAIGRTRTAPNNNPKQLRFAVASCQRYEIGYFNSYRHMLDDDLDFVVHVGDYIYEYASGGGDAMRSDGSNEIVSLADYRARYALYKRDPHLQAAHAAYPWLVTWDDHEVCNDYFGAASYNQDGEEFLARRAAAYRAYYEHMPLPRSARPSGANMLLYAERSFGDLLSLRMLDSRQYRSPFTCNAPEDGGGPGARCAALFDAARTKLGLQQEAWLQTSLSAQSTTRGTMWNVLAQGTPMAYADLDPGPGVAFRRDSWDGYPAARQRLLDALTATRARNPVVLDGDIHAFQLANLHRNPSDLESPIAASEFTTTSVTSGGISQRGLDERRKFNPNILYGNSSRRGYLLLDVTRERMQGDLIAVDTIRDPISKRNSLARYVVEAGKPGLVVG